MDRKETFDQASDMSTMICESFVLRGSIEKTHDIRVEGTIFGDIKQANTVVIAETGVVLGNIKAKNLIVFGCVEGDISVIESISIKGTGKITGKLDTQLLTLEDGATYEGIVVMKPLSL